LDHGDENAERACVEDPADHARLVPGHAHDRRCRRLIDGTDHRERHRTEAAVLQRPSDQSAFGAESSPHGARHHAPRTERDPPAPASSSDLASVTCLRIAVTSTSLFRRGEVRETLDRGSHVLILPP
jgi:hypothetical protein